MEVEKLVSQDRHFSCRPASGGWLMPTLLITMMFAGCASGPNPYQHLTARDELRESSPEITFRYGKPNLLLDGMQKVAELPSRILQGGRLTVNHAPTEETCEILTDYMQENNITDVPVLVNQYDPLGEWKRLHENDQIAPAWKYTAGTFTLINYTIMPGRVFGRDDYNPFTNSLYLNSGRLSDCLHAAAYAKDVHNRDAPGAYAAVNTLPLVTLWKTTHAVNDVVSYAQARDNWQLESGVYRDQFPQAVVKTMVPAGFFLTPVANVALAVSGGAVGYAVGRTVEQQRLAERRTAEEAALREETSGKSLVKMAAYDNFQEGKQNEIDADGSHGDSLENSDVPTSRNRSKSRTLFTP